MKTILRLFLTGLAAATAHATPITAVTNSSSIAISGSGTLYHDGNIISTSYTAADNAIMLSPFNAALNRTAIIPLPSDYFGESATSTALQNSFIEGGHIEARGSVSARSNPDFENFFQAIGSAQASSIFDLIFFTSEAISYHITGWLGVGTVGSGDVATFSLSLFGGASIVTGGSADILDLSGTLEPGTYRLTALAETSVSGARHYADSGSGEFNLTADFAPATVPESGSTLALLVFALAGLIRLRRSHAKTLRQYPDT
jgi:VPDSG-CTERM motif